MKPIDVRSNTYIHFRANYNNRDPDPKLIKLLIM